MTSKSATLSTEKKVKKITSRDLFSIKVIEEPRIFPDGTEILFVLKSFQPEKNEYESHIELIPFQRGGESRRFTQGPHDSSPRISPDGKWIAFMRKTNDHSQIFVMPKNGGEAKQLTRWKNKISEIAWSPDGKQIALVAAIAKKGLVSEEEKEEDDLYEKHNADVKVVDRIFYKLDGEGFLHDKRKQIFLYEIETGKTTQLTFSEHDASSPAFSPDGKLVAFSSNRDPDSDHMPVISHIYVVPVGGGEPKNLTPGQYGFMSPSFSPDGKWIACVGTDEPHNWYANPMLWIVPANGGKPESLTRKLDRPVGDLSICDLRGFEHSETPQWSHDSREIFVSLSDSGETHLISVDAKNGNVKSHAQGKHVVYGWDVAPQSRRAAIAISDPVNPGDLWNLELDAGNSGQLTNVNASFLEEFSIAPPEPFSVSSPDGTKVEGWILKPPEFQESKKYPAILEIHGGPMAMYAWSFFFEFQLLANNDFIVLYSNPRGSMGYGQSFCHAIEGDWGNLDYQDVMTFLESALKKGFIDEKRLGVAGGSYGGFMTNWIVGHTDRFKAAVTMRSVTSETSMFGTSDFGFLAEENMGGVPWEKREAYWKMSPLSYVANIKTPLLIEHSEDDLRCPIEQAEQLYASLKKLKREVLFIRFPGESHGISRSGKPWHRIFRLDQILAWFEKYLK